LARAHNSHFASREQPLTIDTHHHMLPEFFWRETDNELHIE